LIIHSHNILFTFFSLSKTDILSVHDGLYYSNKSQKNKFLFVFSIIERIAYCRSKIVHFISTYTKEQSLFGDKKNYVIIPNTSHFEPLLNSKILNEDKNINKEVTVLIVRSIEERVRFDLVLNVAKKLVGKNIKFIVAGKGPLLEYFKKEILKDKLTNILMLGYVDDDKLLQLYSSCDLILMIAEYGEGFGLPIIEGYLFNKPVIASNRCAIPEVIISKDYLFENTVESIIHTLNSVSNDKKANYREYYNANFSNSIIIFILNVNIYINHTHIIRIYFH